jgi:ABC-type bacteriocin/lantibiotic exporter with double-glycine peptidase domain
MSLLNKTYYYLKNEELTKYLLFFILLRIILNSIVSYIMVLISNGNFNLIIYYILLSYIQKMFNSLIIQPIISKLTNSIQKKFYKNYTFQYNKLTYECKNSKIHSQFIENIRDATQSITMMIDWGLLQAISLFSAFISIFITFSQKDLINHLFIFLIIYSLFYLLVIKKKQKNYSKSQKEHQSKRAQNNAKEFLYSIPFQYKEISPDFIINIKENTLDSQLFMAKSWNQLIILNDSMIEFISCFLIYLCSNDILTFMLIVISMNKLSGAIQGLNGFMTQYQRFNSEYNNFEEFWEKDLEFENNFIKLSIKDHDIKIGNIQILRGDNYTIKNDISLNKLKFSLGMKILIQGPSGHGKSSFLKGLFGLIKSSNIDFSYGSGIQYYHSVSDYFQEIKERMPSSKVSLRDYFKGEINNEIIKEYLLQAW